MLTSQKSIRPVAYGLALYFLLTPLDCMSLGKFGSALRLAALIPLALMLLELRTMCLRVNNLLVVHVLFWLLATVSLFFSVNQSKTITSVLTLTMNYVLILTLGHMQTYNQAEVTLLKRAMLWSGWVTVGMMIAFTGISAEEGRLTLNVGGSAQDENYINGYFLYAFSYHCDQLLRQRKTRHGFAVVLMLGIVLMTGSRGALAAFVLCALVHMWLYIKDTRFFVRNMLILLVLLMVASVAFEWILRQLPDSVSVRFSWDYLMEKGTIGRTRIWKYLWQHFRDSTFLRMLFGNGYGTTAIVNQLNGLVAHNLYLDNLITLGILGVCVQVMTQGTVAFLMIKEKDWAAFGAYVGMIGMCMSLSLVAYTPIWNMVILTMALLNQKEYDNR